jgi:tetratricopeptide (TPR) repeat protein
MFLEKRVYQGSSGKVYPYPVVDKILDDKQLKSYHLIFLENEYVHIALMPEIGGRVYRALDKTNNYDFVYYNRVIKPALVGLTGPWISGGIEFNWPQHHRPNTFGPVEYVVKSNEDGSKTVWMSEIDRMYGTKMTAGFTLFPGRAYLEIQVQLYNGTPEPQSFLWWANPAVAANDHTQSIFPPDVRAVFDHGRRDVSRFPIATGTYYKMDYSEGVDISRHKNIPVPTSYMAHFSDYDFIGSYDHAQQAGMLHIANHHIAPGKKQWTWGNGDFGKAWQRNLTDEDGPYVELMAGVYTDNQPDFSWLQPYEEKSFKHYFLPYKHIGIVKNASIDAAINLEVDQASLVACVQVYATSLFEQAIVQLEGKSQRYLDMIVTLSPTEIVQHKVMLEPDERVEDLRVTVCSAQGELLVSYQQPELHIEPLPLAAQLLPVPEVLSTNEALYLAGQHLEQYRHATFAPDPYYLEGLKRDPDDSRLNMAYGVLLLRRGSFAQSESYFRQAIRSLTRYNPNPLDGEVFYQLGMALKMQGCLDEAFSAFYKATWSAAWQESGYFALAQIACARSEYGEALELVERSLIRNTRNYQARGLQAVLLRKLGRLDEAAEVVESTLRLDVANFWAYYERVLLAQVRGATDRGTEALAALTAFLRGDVHNFLALASDYAHCGLYIEAGDILRQVVACLKQPHPLVYYHLGYYALQSGQTEQAGDYWQTASEIAPDYCFPNTLDDLLALECVLQVNPAEAMAHYYLGNLLYDKHRHLDAIEHWEQARTHNVQFATVHRNLALAYYNILNQSNKALVELETAFALNSRDARVLFELDQLYKKLNYALQQRLTGLKQHWELVEARDDLYVEYVTLLNTTRQYEHALTLLNNRRFHPWEGGEGKVIGQYVLALVELGKQQLQAGQYQQAMRLFLQGLTNPEHFGEARLAGAYEHNISYYLGCAYENLGQCEEAGRAFQKAAQGLVEPSSPMFYNDQPPDMIFYQGLAWLKLDNRKEANRRFHKLISYGEQHLFDQVSIDYFAVSLPDFFVFKDDLQLRNQVHCYYMLGLGYLGLQDFEQARTALKHVLELDGNHQGAQVHLALLP